MLRQSPKLQRSAVSATLLLSLLGVAAIATAQPAKRGLQFIEDDMQRALEQARTRKLPLFVEAWAPW